MTAQQGCRREIANAGIPEHPAGSWAPILLSASPVAELLPKARARQAPAASAKRLPGALQKNMDLSLLGKI